jgi:hypothetical protein
MHPGIGDKKTFLLTQSQMEFREPEKAHWITIVNSSYRIGSLSHLTDFHEQISGSNPNLRNRIRERNPDGLLAGGLGFEPRLTDPESAVLPIRRSPI